MNDNELWDAFRTTGHIADYLRYRGVDIYAAQNTAAKGGVPDGDKPEEQNRAGAPHRRSDYPGI